MMLIAAIIDKNNNYWVKKLSRFLLCLGHGFLLFGLYCMSLFIAVFNEWCSAKIKIMKDVCYGINGLI